MSLRACAWIMAGLLFFVPAGARPGAEESGEIKGRPDRREILGSSEQALTYATESSRPVKIDVRWLYRTGIPVGPGPLQDIVGTIAGGDESSIIFSEGRTVRLVMGADADIETSGPWIVVRKSSAFRTSASGRLLGYLLRGVGIIETITTHRMNHEAVITRSFDPIYAGDALIPLSFWEARAAEIRKGSPAPTGGTIRAQVLSIVFERLIGGRGDAVILNRGLGGRLRPGLRVRLEYPLAKPTRKQRPPVDEPGTVFYDAEGEIEILWVAGPLSLGRVLRAPRPVRVGDRVGLDLSSLQRDEKEGPRH